jgi:hypothetical protein
MTSINSELYPEEEPKVTNRPDAVAVLERYFSSIGIPHSGGAENTDQAGTPIESAAVILEKLYLLKEISEDNLDAEAAALLKEQIGQLFSNPNTKEALANWLEVRNSRSWRQNVLNHRETAEEVAALEDEHARLRSALTVSESNSAHASILSTQLEVVAKKLQKAQYDLSYAQGSESFKTPEHTDSSALLKWEQLKSYRVEACEEGFVWLPYFEKLFADMVPYAQDGRWILLTGESGTGKSALANAVATKVSGRPPITVPCTPQTGFRQLVSDRAIDSDGSFVEYGPFVQAFTGYQDSRSSRVSDQGGFVRLDEAFFLGPSSYAAIKEVLQKRPATARELEVFKTTGVVYGNGAYEGKPVLRGAGGIMTTNLPGSRYKGRTPFDAALLRELVTYEVDYPPMSIHRPELYEFMLAMLLDNAGIIHANVSDLAPHYDVITESPVVGTYIGDQRIIGEQKLIEDPTSIQHGALYRFAFACRAIQTAFTQGNSPASDLDCSLTSQISANKVEIGENFSDALTLRHATITLGEIADILSGFQRRFTSTDPRFRVETLDEWLKVAIEQYINSLDDILDKEKVRAIFDYYNLFETPQSMQHEALLDPVSIGYLSPVVPRPYILEEPIYSREKKYATESRYAFLTTSAVNIDVTPHATLSDEVGDGHVVVQMGDAYIQDGQVKIIVGTEVGDKARLVTRSPGSNLVYPVENLNISSVAETLWLPKYVRPETLLISATESIDALAKAGVLTRNSKTGELGYSYKGGFSPVPSQAEIYEVLYRQRELLDIKFRQGFNTLLFVPYGVPLKKFIRQVNVDLHMRDASELLMTAQNYQANPNDGDILEVDFRRQANLDDLVYHPRYFSNSAPIKPSGLGMPFKGYGLVLVEGNLDIPRDSYKVGGRFIPSTDYFTVRHPISMARLQNLLLDELEANEQYVGESGINIHDWLSLITYYSVHRNILLNSEMYTNFLYLGNSLNSNVLLSYYDRYRAKLTISSSNTWPEIVGGDMFYFGTRNVVRIV